MLIAELLQKKKKFDLILIDRLINDLLLLMMMILKKHQQLVDFVEVDLYKLIVFLKEMNLFFLYQKLIIVMELFDVE
jgi:hypothetical protein